MPKRRGLLAGWAFGSLAGQFRYILRYAFLCILGLLEMFLGPCLFDIVLAKLALLGANLDGYIYIYVYIDMYTYMGSSLDCLLCYVEPVGSHAR